MRQRRSTKRFAIRMLYSYEPHRKARVKLDIQGVFFVISRRLTIGWERPIQCAYVSGLGQVWTMMFRHMGGLSVLTISTPLGAGRVRKASASLRTWAKGGGRSGLVLDDACCSTSMSHGSLYRLVRRYMLRSGRWTAWWEAAWRSINVGLLGVKAQAQSFYPSSTTTRRR
jgi:hypothetical protein